MKIALFVGLILIGQNLTAQTLQEVKRFPITENSLWTVDALNNVIVSSRDRLTKVDENGKLLFDQSQKSLGKIDKIDIVNSLKIMGFLRHNS
ncbi:MAG: hypothetical protein R2779_07745 [Crocinitomicaceae bacterium]